MAVASSLPRRTLSSSKKNGTVQLQQQLQQRKWIARIVFLVIFLCSTSWFAFLLFHQGDVLVATTTTTGNNAATAASRKAQEVRQQQGHEAWPLPEAFKAVLERSEAMRQHCTKLQTPDQFTGFDESTSVLFGGNETVAALPSFGFQQAIASWEQRRQKLNPQDNHDGRWNCQLPPETECQETQFTVIFMAYNPDRLGITMREIRKLLSPEHYHGLVHEIILVWNGPRHVDESKEGKDLLQFAQSNPLRVVYPLKMGFPNDLMNRYHPDVVQVKTKAILFYDDDGPFYSPAAVESGFELWKRHASAQIGAMARELSYCKRQKQERFGISAEPTDVHFVSHCTNVQDKVDYNFRYFANYDANMVLPSGSFLHSNYLCFLWHPLLEPIRDFVLAHPVHPDDMTVSLVVSQLAGRAPRVYSRRLNPDDTNNNNKNKAAAVAVKEKRLRRKLLKGICWDCSQKMDSLKQYWADLRTEAINSLVRYFGSLNSGSIGWCEGTSYYREKKEGKCYPLMAKQGWLPWMQPNGQPKTTCP